MTQQYFWGGWYSKQKRYDEGWYLLLSREAELPLWTGEASCWAALENPGNPWWPRTPALLYPANPLAFRLKKKTVREQKVSWPQQILFATKVRRQSEHHWPLRVLPAFVIRVLAAVFLRPVFPLLPLPPSLLPLLLLGGFAAAGDDAVQHPLVSVRVSGVSFH